MEYCVVELYVQGVLCGGVVLIVLSCTRSTAWWGCTPCTTVALTSHNGSLPALFVGLP